MSQEARQLFYIEVYPDLTSKKVYWIDDRSALIQLGRSNRNRYMDNANYALIGKTATVYILDQTECLDYETSKRIAIAVVAGRLTTYRLD